MTTTVSSDTIAKAATLKVVRVSEGAFSVDSASHPDRKYTVRNTKDGLVCGCPSGYAGVSCAHRIAVERMAEIREARTFAIDGLSTEELASMTLTELSLTRDAATTAAMAIAEQRSAAIKQRAVLQNDTDLYKRLGKMDEHHAAKTALTTQKAICEALSVRQSAMKLLATSLQNAIRNAQSMGG